MKSADDKVKVFKKSHLPKQHDKSYIIMFNTGRRSI